MTSTPVASLNRFIQPAIDLLYPPRCGGCGRFGEGWWCGTCEGRVRPLSTAQQVSTLYGDTNTGLQLTVITACAFAPPLQDAIHRFKYEGMPQLHVVFSHWLMRVWQAHHTTSDVFVPVPLHVSRQRERGYNQSELLARDVATALQVPLLPKALRRTRKTQQQAHLDAAGRKANVQDAFEADVQMAQGRRIVLMDDVLTTGATLIACATALLAHGANDVIALTLARA